MRRGHGRADLEQRDAAGRPAQFDRQHAGADLAAHGRSDGNIVERALDASGNLVNQRTVGSVLDLTGLGGDTTNTAGQTARRVRDTSGAIIELTLDTAGRVLNSRVVSQATGTQRQP